MRDCIRTLCLMSILFSAAVWIAPQGGAKQVLRILCSLALLASVLRSVSGIDFSSYALESAKYREREAELVSKGTELRDRLNRLIIEEEYRTYIEDKAAELGICAEEVRIGVRWSTDGVWVPDRSRIRLKSSEGVSQLSTLLLTELGIPLQKQEWALDE